MFCVEIDMPSTSTKTKHKTLPIRKKTVVSRNINILDQTNTKLPKKHKCKAEQKKKLAEKEDSYELSHSKSNYI